MKKLPVTETENRSIVLTFTGLIILITLLQFILKEPNVFKYEWISVSPSFLSLSMVGVFFVSLFFKKFEVTHLIEPSPETENDYYLNKNKTSHYTENLWKLWIPAFGWALTFSLATLLLAFLQNKICYENCTLTGTLAVMVLSGMSSFYFGYRISLYFKRITNKEEIEEIPFSGYPFAQRTKKLVKRQFGRGYTGVDTRSVTRHS